MKIVRELTPEQIRMVEKAGLSVEAVRLGWNMGEAYGNDFKGFLRDLAKTVKLQARA